MAIRQVHQPAAGLVGLAGYAAGRGEAEQRRRKDAIDLLKEQQRMQFQAGLQERGFGYSQRLQQEREAAAKRQAEAAHGFRLEEGEARDRAYSQRATQAEWLRQDAETAAKIMEIEQMRGDAGFHDPDNIITPEWEAMKNALKQLETSDRFEWGEKAGDRAAIRNKLLSKWSPKYITDPRKRPGGEWQEGLYTIRNTPEGPKRVGLAPGVTMKDVLEQNTYVDESGQRWGMKTDRYGNPTGEMQALGSSTSDTLPNIIKQRKDEEIRVTSDLQKKGVIPADKSLWEAEHHKRIADEVDRRHPLPPYRGAASQGFGPRIDSKGQPPYPPSTTGGGSRRVTVDRDSHAVVREEPEDGQATPPVQPDRGSSAYYEAPPEAEQEPGYFGGGIWPPPSGVPAGTEPSNQPVPPPTGTPAVDVTQPETLTAPPVQPPDDATSRRMVGKGYEYVPGLDSRGQPKEKPSWRRPVPEQQVVLATGDRVTGRVYRDGENYTVIPKVGSPFTLRPDEVERIDSGEFEFSGPTTSVTGQRKAPGAQPTGQGAQRRISPSGKYEWDGTKWIPRGGR